MIELWGTFGWLCPCWRKKFYKKWNPKFVEFIKYLKDERIYLYTAACQEMANAIKKKLEEVHGLKIIKAYSTRSGTRNIRNGKSIENVQHDVHIGVTDTVIAFDNNLRAWSDFERSILRDTKQPDEHEDTMNRFGDMADQYKHAYVFKWTSRRYEFDCYLFWIPAYIPYPNLA